jgi:Flavin-binding monooxygenase-like
MWLALRSNVEVRRVLLRIGPRGFGEQVNGGTPFDLEVVVGEILHRLAGDPGCRRPHAHHFLDRAPRELRPVDEESPLVRILDEHAHRQTKLVARGVDAAEHGERSRLPCAVARNRWDSNGRRGWTNGRCSPRSKDERCTSRMVRARTSTPSFYAPHFPFLADELKLRTHNRMHPPHLYKGIMWLDNPKLMYLGMQDQFYTFSMFDAQAWYARDVILGRIKLPSKEEMAKDDAAWVKREEALKTAFEKIDFQADYVRELCAATDYPKFDIDMTVDEFKEWEHDKVDSIVGYRNKAFKSPCTGTMAGPPHTLARGARRFDEDLSRRQRESRRGIGARFRLRSEPASSPDRSAGSARSAPVAASDDRRACRSLPPSRARHGRHRAGRARWSFAGSASGWRW